MCSRRTQEEGGIQKRPRPRLPPATPPSSRGVSTLPPPRGSAPFRCRGCDGRLSPLSAAKATLSTAKLAGVQRSSTQPSQPTIEVTSLLWLQPSVALLKPPCFSSPLQPTLAPAAVPSQHQLAAKGGERNGHGLESSDDCGGRQAKHGANQPAWQSEQGTRLGLQ